MDVNDREKDRKALVDYPDYKRDENFTRYGGAQPTDGAKAGEKVGSLPVDPYGLYRQQFVAGAHPQRRVQAPSFGAIYADDMRIPEKAIGGKRDNIGFKN